MADEMQEGTRDRPGTETRSEVWTVRLKPSTGDLIRKLATDEDRRPADMLRLLIQDGYRVRTAKR